MSRRPRAPDALALLRIGKTIRNSFRVVRTLFLVLEIDHE